MSDMNYSRSILSAALRARLVGPVNAAHSNVYAEEAQGSRFGAVSTETFNQRLRTQRNRQVIGSYRQSRIGAIDTTERRVSESGRVTPDVSRRPGQLPERESMPVAPRSLRSFQEPTSRSFNPYS
jgi:hypothetical protein